MSFQFRFWHQLCASGASVEVTALWCALISSFGLLIPQRLHFTLERCFDVVFCGLQEGRITSLGRCRHFARMILVCGEVVLDGL